MNISNLIVGGEYLLRTEMREEPVVYIGRDERRGRVTNSVIVKTVRRGVELVVAPRSLHKMEAK